MSWVIYKHTNLQNNKAYIGLTKQNVNRRWQSGNGYNKSLAGISSLYDAIKETGGSKSWNTAWAHEIIEDNITTLALANEREKYWIAYYHTYIGDPECWGYNLTSGGDSHPCSEETKQKISEAHLGKKVLEETKQKLSELNSGAGNPFFGKHHTKEVCAILSELATGRHLSAEAREKISKANKGKVPPNKGKKVSEETRQKIKLARAKQIRKPWSEDQKKKLSIAALNSTKNKKRVKCVETGIIYKSLSTASKETGIAICNISRCLHGKQKSAGGYHWEFIND